jgi:glycerol-3-phosphate acyltransferase PlsX
MMSIAIDAMGGDHGPAEVVAAAAAASLALDIELLLVGQERVLTQLLAEHEYNPERIAVFHAPDVIGMHEEPRRAVLARPEASVHVTCRLVADGTASAMVSAGNTGAVVLAAAQHFNRIPGVSRAALASVFPTETRRGEKDDPFSLILDVGATIEASAQELVAFAIMGSAYASRISKNPRPRVALLSNGTEDTKGLPSIVEANRILRAHRGIHFIGNIEGMDIPRGTADVVVCAGFYGNVVLKMLEGVSETILELASYAHKEKLVWRAGLYMLRGGVARIKELTDWEQYGGAPILGLDKVVIKAHGRSRARAVGNAIKVAVKSAAAGMPERIQEGLAQLPPADDPAI